MNAEGSVPEDLLVDYDRSGFGRRLGPGTNPVLLIVDFVKAYLAAQSPLFADVQPALRSASRVLDIAREMQVPVIFTKVVYREPDGADGRTFFRKASGLQLFVGDSELAQISDELSPRPTEVVLEKKFASAFFETPLAALLKGNNVDTVVICGLSTSGCVRASAVDAVQLGFVPIVVREAVGDRDKRPHEASLFDLDAKYADVMTEVDVMAYLRALPEEAPRWRT